MPNQGHGKINTTCWPSRRVRNGKIPIGKHKVLKYSPAFGRRRSPLALLPGLVLGGDPSTLSGGGNGSPDHNIP